MPIISMIGLAPRTLLLSLGLHWAGGLIRFLLISRASLRGIRPPVIVGVRTGIVARSHRSIAPLGSTDAA